MTPCSIVPAIRDFRIRNLVIIGNLGNICNQNPKPRRLTSFARGRVDIDSKSSYRV